MTDDPRVAPAKEDELRAEVRDWVKSNWDPSMSLRAWREKLVDAGWAVQSWPERWYGKGLPAWADEVVRSEIHDCHAVSTTATGPAGLAGPLEGAGAPVRREGHAERELMGRGQHHGIGNAQLV